MHIFASHLSSLLRPTVYYLRYKSHVRVRSLIGSEALSENSCMQQKCWVSLAHGSSPHGSIHLVASTRHFLPDLLLSPLGRYSSFKLGTLVLRNITWKLVYSLRHPRIDYTADPQDGTGVATRTHLSSNQSHTIEP
jgi:hypothetical protein